MTALRVTGLALLAGAILFATLLFASARMSPLALLGPYAPIANLWPSVSGWIQGARADHYKVKSEALQAENDALKQALESAQATTEAATNARAQNDVEVPRVRAATATRIDRPDSGSPADTEQRLRDDAEAVADYTAAADSLRGTQPR